METRIYLHISAYVFPAIWKRKEGNAQVVSRHSIVWILNLYIYIYMCVYVCVSVCSKYKYQAVFACLR